MLKHDLRVKRAVILVISILLLLILAIASVLVTRQLDSRVDRSTIYGVWEEQNVPDYAQDLFTVREEGIYINERIVDVDYAFDGSTLIYEYDEQEYVYVIRDEDNTVFQRIAPLHYESLFHLRGKYQSEKEQTPSQ